MLKLSLGPGEIRALGRLAALGALLTAALGAKHLISPLVPEAAWLLFATSALCALSVPLFPRAPRLIAHMLAGAVFLAIGAVSWLRGGFVDSVLVWSMTFPMAAGMLGNRRATIIWSGLVLAQYSGLYALWKLGANPRPLRLGEGFIGLVVLLIGVACALLLIDRARRIAAAERDMLQHQLSEERRMESLGRVAAGMAHDFGDLLTTIQTRAALGRDLASRGGDPRPSLEAIDEAARKGAWLTWQLLELNPSGTPCEQNTDPGVLLNGLIDISEHLLPDNIKLQIQVSPDVHPVRGERQLLERVLVNLLTNAREAMPKGGQIDIDCQNEHLPHGPHVRLRMKDTGLGISEEALPRIFEPFFSTKAKPRGAGLGLSTVYGLVKRIGGTITVESSLGQGATFELLLPATPPSHV